LPEVNLLNDAVEKLAQVGRKKDHIPKMAFPPPFQIGRRFLRPEGAIRVGALPF
jgi:hypothetical protein